MIRSAPAAAIALFLILPLGVAPARADTHAAIRQTFAALDAWADAAADQAQDFAADARMAVILGGAIVSQNRNIISGTALGCSLGAAAGAGSTVVLAVPSGGATIAATPQAIALGCALGAASGAALGYELDYPEGR